MKKEFLPIGTVVGVYKTIYAFYTDKKECAIGLNELKKPVVGVVVGATYIIEGSLHYSSYFPSYSPFGNEHPYLVENKRSFVYLVRQGLTNKPLKVFPRDIFVIPTKQHTTPFFYSNRLPISEKDRRFLRHIMNTIPRDAKGRWLK